LYFFVKIIIIIIVFRNKEGVLYEKGFFLFL
jgi:hypothetical protein